MRIQVLVATMFQTDYDLLKRLKIDSDAVVVNQCDVNSEADFEWNGHSILWLNTTERGLSKSRNKAIKNASADVCVIADDDEELCDGYAQTVLSEFEARPNVSIIRFNIQGIEKKFKEYPKEEYYAGYIKTMKFSSVELAFRRDAVVSNGILFNELIGAGTKFMMGEENTFLFRCLDKKLKIMYVPKTLARLHIGDSTWFEGYDDKYMIAKGAAFTAMSDAFSSALILQFAIRKRNLYNKNISVFKCIKLMFRGRKEYRNDLKLLKNL